MKSAGAVSRRIAIARVKYPWRFWWRGAAGGMARLVQADARSSAKSVGQVSRSVDNQNGVDAGAVAALLKEARRVIIAARGALF